MTSRDGWYSRDGVVCQMRDVGTLDASSWRVYAEHSLHVAYVDVKGLGGIRRPLSPENGYISTDYVGNGVS